MTKKRAKQLRKEGYIYWAYGLWVKNFKITLGNIKASGGSGGSNSLGGGK